MYKMNTEEEYYLGDAACGTDIEISDRLYFDIFLPDDDNFENDCMEFIEALYPVIEYSYLCDSDSDDVYKPPLKVQFQYQWVFEKMFTNQYEAEALIGYEETWGYHSKSPTPEGLKVVYRCTKLHRDGPQCAAKVYLLYHKESSMILLFRTIAKHDHDNVVKRIMESGITNERKPKKLKQKSILDSFTNKNNS